MQAEVAKSEKPQTSRKTTNVNRAYVLVCVVLAQSIALVLLLQQDGSWQRWMASLNRSTTKPGFDAPGADPRADPKLGFSLQSAAVASKITASGPYLLLPVADCATCVSADIKGWVASAKRQGVTVVFLTSANREQVSEMQKTLKVDCPVIFDPDSKIEKTLNAQWAARAYLFSDRWRLLWLQESFALGYQVFDDSKFLNALKELKQ